MSLLFDAMLGAFLNLGGRERTCCKVSQHRTVSYHVGSLAERGQDHAWDLSHSAAQTVI